MPDHDAFHLKDEDDLRSEIARLGLDIPLGKNLSLLGDSLSLCPSEGERVAAHLPNRFCVQPMEGCDANPDGSPGPLTFRRYVRYAQGGFGLIWIEAVAVLSEARSTPAQLWLHPHNATAFLEFVKAIRKAAQERHGRNVVMVLQVAHAGRYSRPEGKPTPFLVHHNPEMDRAQGIPESHALVTDDYLDRLQDGYLNAARLAAEAGFDGVDVKSCNRDLVSELLAASLRSGKYGGRFENRTRFLCETIERIRGENPDIFVTTRLNVYDAIPYPFGFGNDKDDSKTPDLKDPLKLIKQLQRAGIPLLNVAAGFPGGSSRLTGIQSEHPLQNAGRMIGLTQRIQEAFPSLPIVSGGYSWFRQFLPLVAAGVIERGGASLVGMGRSALAYPDAPADLVRTGRMTPEKCCISCSACNELVEAGGKTGCVIRDNATYGADYRQRRHFSVEILKDESQRCHYCEAANCSEACPAHMDVPGFIKAFADGNIRNAYGIMRRSNALPEMCSHLCPTWMMCEGACIETLLTGKPIPIRDIQYAIAWLARSQGLSRVDVPTACTGRNIAVVGGGPAGLAGAIRLIEKGHHVVIFERADQLGGIPEIVIPSNRYAGAMEEIHVTLSPALESARLEIRFGQELGRNLRLESLREQYDTVLLACGVWQEISLDAADLPSVPAGVTDAITFLRAVKTGDLTSVPERVAVLGGGDSAMDASAAALQLGATDVYVVYPGPLSEMHWHMPDDWFRSAGAHGVMLALPVGYETDIHGKLIGLRISRTEMGAPDESGRRQHLSIPGTESVLKVDMVITAMGLRVSGKLKKAVKGVTFSGNDLLQTVAANSFATRLDKVFAAGALINGGASAVQCIAEGMKAADEIDEALRARSKNEI